MIATEQSRIVHTFSSAYRCVNHLQLLPLNKEDEQRHMLKIDRSHSTLYVNISTSAARSLLRATSSLTFTPPQMFPTHCLGHSGGQTHPTASLIRGLATVWTTQTETSQLQLQRGYARWVHHQHRAAVLAPALCLVTARSG